MGLFDWLKGKKSEPTEAISPTEHFTREMEGRFLALPNVTVKRGAEEMSLVVTAHGKDFGTFLGNIFHDTREVEPERREEIINRFVLSIVEPEPSYDTLEEARESLAVTLRGPIGGHVFAAREFLPCLQEYLVIDGANRIAFCTPVQLEQWKTPLETLLEIGRQKLINADNEATLSDEARGVWSIDTGDDYETARLLVPGFLASFRDRVKGRPIAVAPTRDQLYIGGDEDPQLVISFCDLAEREYAASPRRVSAAIYSVDTSGRVVPYVRDVKDEAALRAQASHVRFEGNEYSTQKEELEAKNEEEGVDVFVASFSGIKTERGEVLSWSSVAEGVRTWLPRTDMLAIQSNAEPALFPWSEVMRVAPQRLTRHPTLFPPRWETLGDFTDEEISQMKPLTP